MDTVFLKNGDRVIGSIKEVTQGVLTIKPDYSKSDYKLKWEEIADIFTSNELFLTFRSGAKVRAQVEDLTPDSIQVDISEVVIRGKKSYPIQDLGPFMISRRDLVFVEKIEDTFFERLNGDISIGLNLARSNSFKQYSLRSNVEYNTGRFIFGGNFNGILSSQDDTETIRREDGGLTIISLLRNEYFILARGNFLSNTEQLIDLRTDFKLGVGKFIVFKPKAKLSVQAGLNLNSERFDGDSPDNQSAETVIGITINFLDLGPFTIQGILLGYSGISENGRLRSDSKLDLKYEFLSDLFIKVGGTLNYDNKPAEGASDTDYVFQSTIGWSF